MTKQQYQNYDYGNAVDNIDNNNTYYCNSNISLLVKYENPSVLQKCSRI